MSLASPPRRIARVCDVCRCWPCMCQRDPDRPVYSEPSFRVESCVCGGSVVVYETTPANIAAAVAAHNDTVGHAIWRRRLPA